MAFCFLCVEVSSIHQSKITLTVVVITLVVVLAPIILLSIFLVWYRISRSHKHQYQGPPTYVELRIMSTIYDPDDIPQETDAYTQAPQKEYSITYMDLQMMKTDKDD